MTKIFKSNSTALFVSKADKVTERGAYSVILSPEFYWVKRVTLPVKKERDALKLAPSVYEGSLPAGAFSFEARKHGDEFIMIAYDKQEISTALAEIMAHKSDIVDVYFGQDALANIEECTSVNDDVALSNMDGVIIQVPRKCTNTSFTLDESLEGAHLGKHKVKLSSFDNALLSTKEISLIATIFGLLLVSLFSEYFVYKSALGDLEEKRAEIISQYDLPQTSIQLKSIKKSLYKKFKTQKEMRDILYTLSKLELEDGEFIQSIEESHKETVVVLFVTSDASEAKIKKMLSKNVKVKESSVETNLLTLKIAS